MFKTTSQALAVTFLISQFWFGQTALAQMAPPDFAQAKKRIFFQDYQRIALAHPQRAERRLELAFYRNALAHLMETEFYLALMRGEGERFGRVSSAIAPLPGTSDFYHSLRQHHQRWQRHFWQNAASIRPLITTMLISLAHQLQRIERGQEDILQALSDLQDIDEPIHPENISNPLIADLVKLSLATAEDRGDPQLKIDTREKIQQELVNLARTLMQSKDDLFAGQAWATILYREVDWQGSKRPLKDHLLAVVDTIPQRGGPGEVFDRLTAEVRPLLKRAAADALEGLSHLIHLYRTHRQRLLAHDLIREQTLEYLEEWGDGDALKAYHQLVGGEEAVTFSSSDAVIAAGAIGVCFFGGRLVAVPLAGLMAATGVFDYFSFKKSLLTGANFGLNRPSLFEMASVDSPFFRVIKELSVVGISIISCSTPRGLSSVTGLVAKARQFSGGGVGNRLKEILSPQNIKWQIWDKISDLNAAPTSFSSVLILAAIQAHKHGPASIMTSPDFHLTAMVVAVIEFVFVFKSIQSGVHFFSRQHFRAMGDVARTIFGLTLVTQAAYSLAEDRPYDIDRAFFEGTYDSMVGLTTAKMILLYLATPFTGKVQNALRLAPDTARRVGVFLLMLVRNGIGNYLYLSSVNAVFNQERPEAKIMEEMQ